MQLVLLMTNPLLLLFPREHLCTQQNTELGLLHRELLRGWHFCRDIQTLLGGAKAPRGNHSKHRRGWRNISKLPCNNFCSSCGEFSALGCLLIPRLPLNRAAGGLWEKVPVTAPAVPGFLAQRPHDMNKDTGLTRKEKKLQKYFYLRLPHATHCILNQRHTTGLLFHVFLGSICGEQLSYTAIPAVIHVLWFSLTQGARLALGSAITAWLCPALLTLTGSKPPALPLLTKARTSSPGLCSEQSQNHCLGRAESHRACRDSAMQYVSSN